MYHQLEVSPSHYNPQPEPEQPRASRTPDVYIQEDVKMAEAEENMSQAVEVEAEEDKLTYEVKDKEVVIETDKEKWYREKEDFLAAVKGKK